MNLRPIGSSQFVVELDGGLEVLFSYLTPVACRWTNGSSNTYYKTAKKWSPTTSRHVNNYIGRGFPLVIEKDQSYFDALLSDIDYRNIHTQKEDISYGY